MDAALFGNGHMAKPGAGFAVATLPGTLSAVTRPVRGAVELMGLTGLWAQRRTLGLLAIAALAIPGVASAQAVANARVFSELSGCSFGASASPSGSSTSVAAIIDAASGGCTARGSGYSYLGVVGASASSRINSESNQTGGFDGTASGSWSDGLNSTWPERFQVITGVDHVVLRYNVSATGVVGATRALSVDGFFLAGGAADIRYAMTIAGRSFSGTKGISLQGSEGSSSETGTWGNIQGSVRLDAQPLPGGGYSMPSISLAMSGSASAGVFNFSNFGVRSASATADFSSTLQWKGVSGVQAFDANGQEIALPADFELELIGQQTGFNYWNEAPKLPVPEPGSWALMLAGLGLLTRHSVTRRQHWQIGRQA
jgi:hypothetical protein